MAQIFLKSQISLRTKVFDVPVNKDKYLIFIMQESQLQLQNLNFFRFSIFLHLPVCKQKSHPSLISNFNSHYYKKNRNIFYRNKIYSITWLAQTFGVLCMYVFLAWFLESAILLHLSRSSKYNVLSGTNQDSHKLVLSWVVKCCQLFFIT